MKLVIGKIIDYSAKFSDGSSISGQVIVPTNDSYPTYYERVLEILRTGKCGAKMDDINTLQVGYRKYTEFAIHPSVFDTLPSALPKTRKHKECSADGHV